MTDSWAAETRRSGWETDTIYRRPPAQPVVESTTGESWLTGADLPAEPDSPAAEQAEPRYDTATPATARSSTCMAASTRSSAWIAP